MKTLNQLTDQDNIYKLYSNIKKDSEVKECFYHKTDECKGEIKNAHSISRSGRLDLVKGLVNKNEKVYSLSEITIENGIPKKCIKDIGWGQAASTFFGFCDYHDTNLFLPIENNNDFDNSLEHYFLHSYRSFAHTFHLLKKTHKLVGNSIDHISNFVNESLKTNLLEASIRSKEQIDNLNAQNISFPKEELKKESEENLFPQIENLKKSLAPVVGIDDIDLSLLNLTNLNSFKDISELIDKIPGLVDQLQTTLSDSKDKLSYSKEQFKSEKLHSWIEWMKKYKEKLDNIIENKSYEKLKYYCRVKNELFPFACAFAFSPDFLYSGIHNFIIPPSNPEDILNSCLIVTVLPDRSNKTIILFACFEEDKQSEFFLNKLFSIVNEEEFERAVTSITVNKASNVFLNPLMWEKLGDRQSILEKEINLKRSFDELPEKPFMSEINFFSKEFSAKELGIR